jgi:hypothetical protein
VSEACRTNLRIVRGEPTAEELAALAALVAAASGAEDAVRVPARGGWSDPARIVPRLPQPGPGAWRASLR